MIGSRDDKPRLTLWIALACIPGPLSGEFTPRRSHTAADTAGSVKCILGASGTVAARSEAAACLGCVVHLRRVLSWHACSLACGCSNRSRTECYGTFIAACSKHLVGRCAEPLQHVCRGMCQLSAEKDALKVLMQCLRSFGRSRRRISSRSYDSN